MHKKIILLVYITTLFSFSQKKLETPKMISEKPSAGKRVKITPKEYSKTNLFYSLYLPEKYDKNKSYPVIVEYTGNYFPKTNSTGNLKDASLGYAIAKNIDAIWICLPFVTKNNTQALKWWGNEQNTINFALKQIKNVCLEFNGNSGQVFLIGFSRGAIAVNYIGLYNDQIADVWKGFFTHDHYDGQKKWGWAKDLNIYRKEARTRAKRLKGRAALISNNHINGKKYIESNQINNLGNFTYLKPDIKKATIGQNLHMHNDLWMNTQLNDAQKVFNWFKNTMKNNIGVYNISGTVKSKKGKPIVDIIVYSGDTHFAITDKNGFYTIEGVTKGFREVFIENEQSQIIKLNINKNVSNINFVIKQTLTTHY